MQRVGCLAQRDVLPAEMRSPHVDREVPRPVAAAGDGRSAHIERQHLARARRRRPTLVDEPGDAAGAVAAGTRRRTVGVEDPHVGVDAVHRGVGDDHHLLEGERAPAEVAGQIAGQLGRAPALVHHQDGIAGAVHLGKGKHG